MTTDNTQEKDIDVYLKVVRKLVGRINPVGETNADNDSFENLKVMCGIVDKLIADIAFVAWDNKGATEFSRKRASEFAYKFIDENTNPNQQPQ